MLRRLGGDGAGARSSDWTRGEAVGWAHHSGEVSGKKTQERFALSRVCLEDIATHTWVGIFCSPCVSFRSTPKIATRIGPLFEQRFWLFLGLGVVFRYSNSA
jgi:hypothetical protein